MIRKFAAAIVAFGLIGAPLAHAKAPCRDVKGKFTKCETPKKPAKCRDAKGRYTKCSASEAGAQQDVKQASPSAANPS
ncbi:hypothetical protein AA101099_1114 [Neoasaia chiangmaiensis NBRC 101099]|uniref:Uncharacterized protein n=1 Tax=Neoasaia chiangmaiensis TaxID=320497 RepID=A0A1U9KN04_9PROT|nr:hypothetical protein [Neoasaia chiangmaiensis]AQS87184.1 hypothetical protein A0U93_03665 [Neoasaia chiangmaiensis]GBR38264.1 hypothetical protein AA101099_1114 [Neoasaia chiangmaiensis NBRC 101099]GEN15969.1 hypothetical protein NCH01_24000 [Neoasaia chiangmaiensis]